MCDDNESRVTNLFVLSQGARPIEGELLASVPQLRIPESGNVGCRFHHCLTWFFLHGEWAGPEPDNHLGTRPDLHVRD